MRVILGMFLWRYWVLWFVCCVPALAMPALPSVVTADMLPHDDTPLDDVAMDSDLPSIEIDMVNQKLTAFERQMGRNGDTDTPIFAAFTSLNDDKVQNLPVARIANHDMPSNAEPMPDDVASDTPDTAVKPAMDTPSNINPAQYLPDYQATNIAPVASPNSPKTETETDNRQRVSLGQRLYNRLFRDGIGRVPRLSAKIYLDKSALPKTLSDNNKDNPDAFEMMAWRYESQFVGDDYVPDSQLVAADNNKQPFKNMRAALENITQESVSDFNIALPRLREAVSNAAKAVGYYDVDFRLRQSQQGQIDVVIHHVGEPVNIVAKVIDIRGDGATLPEFKQVQDGFVAKSFHHGEYEAVKEDINRLSGEHGFFDGRWLNHSADVILPDNVADVSFVYDTGVQYVFDDVVFFTLDSDNKSLTTDPKKLPLKPDLLKKMVNFKVGEPFRRTAVSNLSNELLTAGYFNIVNVEVVYPQAKPSESAIDFVQTENPTNTENVKDNKEVIEKTPPEQGDVLPTDGVVAVAIDDTQHSETPKQADDTIAPIDFTPSQVMLDKLDLVTAKAQRLLNSPDNRVLDEDKKRASSLLGRISQGISALATKILPDESSDDLLPLPEGVPMPELPNKQTPQAVYQNKKVPLYVFVMTDKSKDALLGVGWGSDTGTRLTARLEDRLINKKGYQAGVDLSASKTIRGFNVFFNRPLSHPVYDKFNAKFKYLEQEQIASGFDLKARTLEQSLSRVLATPNDWQQSYTLRYRLDSLDTKAPKDIWQDLPISFVASRENQQVVLAGVSLSKVVQNDLVAPTAGYRQNYSLEVGSQALWSDTDMAIMRASFGGIKSFGDNVWGKDRRHQLIGRLDLGYLWAKNFDFVPYRLRFFAGGDNSVRGYNQESLSPENNFGYLVGGQVLAVGSAEYNYEFYDGLRAGVFMDLGSAYDKKLSNTTKIGAGLGVRWASPVGLVRLDVAKGVGSDRKETPIKIHFLIGLPF